MAKLPSKVFHSVAEFEAEAENAAKNAMQSTINYFKKMLWQFAQDAIYLNAYTRKWYVRTNWLKNENAIETYMYKNMKVRYILLPCLFPALTSANNLLGSF